MPRGHGGHRGHGGYGGYRRGPFYGGYGGYGGFIPIPVPYPYYGGYDPYYYTKDDGDDDDIINNNDLEEECFDGMYNFYDDPGMGEEVELAPGVFGIIVGKRMEQYDYQEYLIPDSRGEELDEQKRNYLELTLSIDDQQVVIKSSDQDKRLESTFNLNNIDYYIYGNIINDFTLGYTICRIVPI